MGSMLSLSTVTDMAGNFDMPDFGGGDDSPDPNSAEGRRRLIVSGATVLSPESTVFRDVGNGFIRIDQYMQSVDGNLLFTRTYLPCINSDRHTPSRRTESDSESVDAGDSKVEDVSLTMDSDKVKGLICYAIGYAENVDWMIEDVLLPLVQRGFIVFTLDHFGHGRSDGLWISHRMNQIVEDASVCFSEMRKRLNDPLSVERSHLEFSAHMESPNEFTRSNCFLMGHSMGGALCIDLSLKEGNKWRGMVLSAPMISVNEDALPSENVISCMSCMAPCIGDKQWTPGGDMIYDLFQDKAAFKCFSQNPIYYESKPRLGCALSLYQFTQKLEEDLGSVTMPLLLLHGTADKVSELKSSKKLHRLAQTSDKTLKTYRDAWHYLYLDPKAKQTIFEDIGGWVDHRLETAKDGRDAMESMLSPVPAADREGALATEVETEDVRSETTPLLTKEG